MAFRAPRRNIQNDRMLPPMDRQWRQAGVFVSWLAKYLLSAALCLLAIWGGNMLVSGINTMKWI
jgi:hypothetical protein